MAFSLRKMLSNINYFGKPEDGEYDDGKNPPKQTEERSESGDFERTEPDSTSRYATTLKLPESVKNFASKKPSSSDTDILSVPETPTKKPKRKSKKLKLDVEKAIAEALDTSDDTPSENTPKHMLLEPKSADIFKGFDFNKSFDFGSSDEADTDGADIQSISDHTDSDRSFLGREKVKMCRKVQPTEENFVRSTSTDSFNDVEYEKNEEERMSLVLKYQTKLETMECLVKKLLSEFQFNIEVSKMFNCRTVVTDTKKHAPGAFIDSRATTPSGPWNVIVDKEDEDTKRKFKKQLISLKQTIDEFVNGHLRKSDKKVCMKQMRSKKRMRHFDFPDLRDAMINLFDEEDHEIDFNDSKCICHCHSQSETDSGLTTKSDENQSITSSIGNFTLDASTLTAYSESLDQIISYNSFQDSILYTALLQKPAIERLTFYVQVHNIQMNCETDPECESKNTMTFFCPICKIMETDENELLNHILGQNHCEKIHFQYKTAYIKKCVAANMEIQPSTVLNPMTLYRDANKIVCFGDAIYACSLCFEHLIIGESVLMTHCSDPEHMERRRILTAF